MNKRYLTWKDFEEFITGAVEALKSQEITGVYGLPRGGLPIAVTLSHRLGVPLLGAPCKGCIVVDDISDTGITLQHYATNGYTIVTWVARPKWTKVLPFFFKVTTEGNEWFVFPWEENKLTTSETKEESTDGTEQE